MAYTITVTHHVVQQGCGHTFTVTPSDVHVRQGRGTIYSVSCQNPRCRRPFDITIDRAFASAVSAVRQESRS